MFLVGTLRQDSVAEWVVEHVRCAWVQLWHLAKMHGEAADKATDAHFLRAARAHESLIGAQPYLLKPAFICQCSLSIAMLQLTGTHVTACGPAHSVLANF